MLLVTQHRKKAAVLARLVVCWVFFKSLPWLSRLSCPVRDVQLNVCITLALVVHSLSFQQQQLLWAPNPKFMHQILVGCGKEFLPHPLELLWDTDELSELGAVCHGQGLL